MHGWFYINSLIILKQDHVHSLIHVITLFIIWLIKRVVLLRHNVTKKPEDVSVQYYAKLRSNISVR